MAWYHFIPGVGTAILAGETIVKAATPNPTPEQPAQQELNEESKVPVKVDKSLKAENKNIEVNQDKNTSSFSLNTILLVVFGIISVGTLVIVLTRSNKRVSTSTNNG